MRTKYTKAEKANPYSRYWKAMALDAWFAYFRAEPCLLCGSKLTEGHHIMHRSTNPEHATELLNGVALCRYHHVWAHDHNDLFEGLLKLRANEKWAYKNGYSRFRVPERIDYKAVYEDINKRRWLQ